MDNLFQILQNLGTVVGALGIVELLKFFITRHDTRVDKKEDREAKLKKLEEKMQDTVEVRSQEVKKQFEFQAAELRAQCALEQKRYDEIKEVLLKNTESDKERDKYMHTMGEALMGIIHDRILSNADGYIEREGITREELSTIGSLYRPYKELGGNGDVETAYNLILQLDLITKQEAAHRDQKCIEKRYCKMEG